MSPAPGWIRALALIALGRCACAPSSPAHDPAAPSAAATPAPSRQSGPAAAASSSSEPPQAAGYAAAEEEIADNVEETEPVTGASPAAKHPLDDWTEQQVEAAVAEDPAELGSMSIGSPSGGALFNGVQMPEGPLLELVDPAHAWGTRETVEYLQTAVRQVAELHPGSPKLRIGHLSARQGGPLRPHLSHQSGRDVDVSFYYLGPAHRWYARAHSGNLDRQRTWALVRALVTETDVQLILIDHSIQRLLQEHALGIGEDPDWVQSIFRGSPGGLPAIVRHAKGHGTHIHIRFYSPIAQETARRVYPLLVEHGLISAVPQYVRHRVRKGETLGKLARRYETTVRAIQRANGLQSTLIRAGRVYRIPKPRDPQTSSQPVLIPPRRLPPEK